MVILQQKLLYKTSADVTSVVSKTACRIALLDQLLNPTTQAFKLSSI
ncbi:MAG: hypothetical protein QG635_1124 [Bacteroidota bacterium]|nr:hypothetical protein [Bacteroidota bacterium]